MTDAETKRQIVAVLNNYAFGEVYNQPRSEYRVNVKITPYAARYITGSIQIDLDSVLLPQADGPFFVGTAASMLFAGALPINSGMWYRGDELIEKINIFTHVFTVSGKQVPRRYIHIYKLPNKSMYLVAVSKLAMTAVFGVGNHNECYITVFRDSTTSSKISVWCFLVPNNPTATVTTINNTLTLAKNENIHGTTLFVNGVEKRLTTNTYQVGDLVEIVLDRDIVASFDVDLSANLTGYTSARYAGYREIIHCPKSLNPDNKLITHNTCTYYVRDKDTTNGVYLHRTAPNSVAQITHNDVSVSSDVVEALRQSMGANQVIIHVKVRTYQKNNVLKEEISYIEDLYSCDDTTIISHLRGEIDPDLSFWSAVELEDSGYVNLMFDTPNTLAPNVLDTYIDALGYNHVLSILSPHVNKAQINTNTDYVIVPKSFALRSIEAYPITYLRGNKVRDSLIRKTNAGTGEIAAIFDDAVSRNNNDPVVISLVADDHSQPYKFTPSMGTPTIVIPFEKMFVYEEVTLTQPVIGYMTNTTKSYKERPFLSGTLIQVDHANGKQLIFGPSTYGKTYIIYNANMRIVKSPNIQEMIDENLPIAFNLEVTCQNDGSKNVPVIGYQSIQLFINGKRLTEDVDYSATPLTDSNNNICALEVFITNMEYINTSVNTNWLEAVITSQKSIMYESGFVVDNKISYDRAVNVWINGSSLAYIIGKNDTNIIDRGNYLETGGVADGSIYLIETSIPFGISDVLSEYENDVESIRISAINRYFNRLPPEPPGTVLVSGQYKLYSIYISKIIRDIIDGDLVVVDEPEESVFLNQFSQYEYLKLRDPTITQGRFDINRQFVNVSPHYTQIDVPDIYTYRIIERLIKKMLPQDTHTIGDILT